MTSEPGSLAGRRRRRRFQFSLRALLLVVLVVSLGLGWLSARLRAPLAQKRAVQAVLDLGGRVWYEHRFRARDGRLIAYSKKPAPWLERILGEDFFHAVTGVGLEGRRVQDEHLVLLHSLPRTEALWLSNTSVTDDGLVHVRHLKQLDQLDLSGARVTGRGFVHLRDLDQIGGVNLAETAVGDGTLVHLTCLKSVALLDLSRTDVSDQGVTHLKRMTSLRALILEGTQISDEGAEELRRALPNLIRLEYVLDSEKAAWTALTRSGAVCDLGRDNRIFQVIFSNRSPGEDDLLQLKQLKRLKRVRLAPTVVTEEILDKLQASLPGCAIFTP